MVDGPTLILTEVATEMVFICTASSEMGVTRSTFIVKNDTRRKFSRSRMFIVVDSDRL